MAAWVTFNEAIKASTSLVSCCNLIFGMLPGYLSRLSLLSLSQSTSFISSLFFFPIKSFQIESIPRTPARASMWSFTGLRSCVVSNSFSFAFRSLMRWPGFFELAAGFDLAPFRKNVKDVRSSPRPRCLGLDADLRVSIHLMENTFLIVALNG